KRRDTSGSILVSGVSEERSGTDAGVEAGGSVGPERRETNRRIVSAAGQAKKGAPPCCGVAPWIASIRWGTDCLRPVWEREEGNHERDKKESKPRRRPAD